MHLSALQYFKEVIRCGSIRQAAEQNNITPSALSRQIQKLERSYGAPLIERLPSGVRLTAAGEVFLQHTSGILRDLDRVRTLIDDLRGLRRGELNIWAVEGVVAELLAPTIARFSAKYPDIVFNITVSDSHQIQLALMRDEADIGMTFNGLERAEIQQIAKVRLPQHAILSSAHPLAERKSLKLSDLKDYPVALQEKTFGVRRLVDQAMRDSHVTLRHAMTSNSIEMSKALARTGAAITFLHTAAVSAECKAGHLRAIPMDDPILSQATTELCVHRDRVGSFASAAFLKDMMTALSALRDTVPAGRVAKRATRRP